MALWEREEKNLQAVQRVLGYALPLSACKKLNRHSRLLTLALNREDVQDISAVVRVRRCPSRAVLHNFAVLFLPCAGPATRCYCLVLLGTCFTSACFCIFILFCLFFKGPMTRMRTAARPAQGRSGHYKLET